MFENEINSILKVATFFNHTFKRLHEKWTKIHMVVTVVLSLNTERMTLTN